MLQNIKQIRGLTQGSILFLGTNSIVTEDNNNLNFNNLKFSIGFNTGTASFNVRSTGTSSNLYTSSYTDSAGRLLSALRDDGYRVDQGVYGYDSNTPVYELYHPSHLGPTNSPLMAFYTRGLAQWRFRTTTGGEDGMISYSVPGLNGLSPVNVGFSLGTNHSLANRFDMTLSTEYYSMGYTVNEFNTGSGRFVQTLTFINNGAGGAGKISIGNTLNFDNNTRVSIKGLGSTSGTKNLWLRNSVNDDLFMVHDDKNVTFGTSTINTIGGGLTIAGDVYPLVTNTYRLGTASYRWIGFFNTLDTTTLNITGSYSVSTLNQYSILFVGTSSVITQDPRFTFNDSTGIFSVLTKRVNHKIGSANFYSGGGDDGGAFTGDYSLYIGEEAYQGATAAAIGLYTVNLGVGYGVLRDSTNISYHVALGPGSMRSTIRHTTPFAGSPDSSGVSIGANSARGITQYNTSVFIGESSGYLAYNVFRVTSVGNSSLRQIGANTREFYKTTLLGSYAGYNSDTLQHVIGIGHEIFNYDYQRTNVIGIGDYIGYNISMTSSIVIGNYRTKGSSIVTLASGTASNIISIGHGIIPQYPYTINFPSNYSMLIGTYTPAAKITIQGTSSTSATWTAQFHNSTGSSNSYLIRDDGFHSWNTLPSSARYTWQSGSVQMTLVDGGIFTVNSNSSSSPILNIEGTSTGPLVRLRTSTINRLLIESAGRFTSTIAHTATASNDYGWNLTGTLTARSVTSDVLIGLSINPSIIAATSSQTLIGSYENYIFTKGKFSSINTIAKVINTNDVFSYLQFNNSTNLFNTSLTTGLTIGLSGSVALFTGRVGATLAFSSNNTAAGFVDLSQNWFIGSGTSPLARMHISGSGTTSATNALLVQNGVSTEQFRVTNGLSAYFGNSSNTGTQEVMLGTITVPWAFRIGSIASGLYIYQTGSDPSVLNSPGQDGYFIGGRTSTNSTYSRLWLGFIPGAGFNSVTGNSHAVTISGDALHTSGTNNMNILRVTGTINQTGSTGIITAIQVSTTVTNSADYRAFESTSGKVVYGGTNVHSYLVPHRLTDTQRNALTNLSLFTSAIVFNTDRDKLEVYTKGNWETVNTTIFTQTDTKIIQNTATESSVFTTGLGTLTIPANHMKVGKSYRIKCCGWMNEVSTPTVQVKLYFGSTVLVDTGAVTINSLGGTNQFFDAEFVVTVRVTGASGTIKPQGYWKYSANNGAVYNVSTGVVGTVTVNTTVSQTIDLTFQWGVADAGNEVRISNASVEILN